MLGARQQNRAADPLVSTDLLIPNDTASLVYIDCPLPGSTFYDSLKNDQAVWRFTFHHVEDDLPEGLVSGNERTYLRHFFDRLTVNPWAITPGGGDQDVYVLAYARPGALWAAFKTYREFEGDGRQNRELVQRQGKSGVPTLGLASEHSFNNARHREQLSEFHGDVEVESVSNSAHYVPDKNPE
ncbi:hypothetical protein EJ03DRAFT_335741 [Teratosphaeria nubilosa]|uniref:AB hydrolase-1 domain-containing protein n=1 Tax=Teratosphaeria nubilosa TaxID=161662 RepID=A0A6G1LAX3_9PEZI|nr:hypothetical protein EJ03DRAFT_335741 [Teratosphaeria nubilosa]